MCIKNHQKNYFKRSSDREVMDCVKSAHHCVGILMVLMPFQANAKRKNSDILQYVRKASVLDVQNCLLNNKTEILLEYH